MIKMIISRRKLRTIAYNIRDISIVLTIIIAFGYLLSRDRVYVP